MTYFLHRPRWGPPSRSSSLVHQPCVQDLDESFPGTRVGFGVLGARWTAAGWGVLGTPWAAVALVPRRGLVTASLVPRGVVGAHGHIRGVCRCCRRGGRGRFHGRGG